MHEVVTLEETMAGGRVHIEEGVRQEQIALARRDEEGAVRVELVE